MIYDGRSVGVDASFFLAAMVIINVEECQFVMKCDGWESCTNATQKVEDMTLEEVLEKTNIRLPKLLVEYFHDTYIGHREVKEPNGQIRIKGPALFPMEYWNQVTRVQGKYQIMEYAFNQS